MMTANRKHHKIWNDHHTDDKMPQKGFVIQIHSESYKNNLSKIMRGNQYARKKEESAVC